MVGPADIDPPTVGISAGLPLVDPPLFAPPGVRPAVDCEGTSVIGPTDGDFNVGAPLAGDEVDPADKGTLDVGIAFGPPVVGDPLACP